MKFKTRDVQSGFLVCLLGFGVTWSLACEPGAAPAGHSEGGLTLADLKASERSVFSQFGEDGVIEKIFEVIEPGPKFCVEFGAHDGVTWSWPLSGFPDLWCWRLTGRIWWGGRTCCI